MSISDSPNQILMAQEKFNVVNNEEKKRFEVKINGYLAVCEYIKLKTKIIFTHTEVPPALEGQGIGSMLAKTALDYARANELKVQPLCPYIAAYMKKHPEYQDLLMDGFRIK